MKQLLSLRLLLFATLAIVLAPGCANQRLDPAGPYHGDMILYQADGLIEDLDAAYDAFEQLAARHPDWFGANERAAALLDRLKRERDGAWESNEILASLFMARDGYVLVRDGASHDKLRGAIQAARAFIMELQAYVIQD